MSNRRRALGVVAANAPAAAPNPDAPAVEVPGCTFCGAPLFLTGVGVASPPEIAPGAEPTEEEALALAAGTRVMLQVACQRGHTWGLLYVQQPEQPLLRVATDGEGTPLTIGGLQVARQRNAALAQLVVPGRQH